MRVWTGDEIGNVKVTDVASQVVSRVLKPAFPSRELRVTWLEHDATQNTLLVCRRAGTVELVDLSRPGVPLWAVPVAGAPLFATVVADSLLYVVTEDGYVMLFEVGQLPPFAKSEEVKQEQTDWYAETEPRLAHALQLADGVQWDQCVRNPDEVFTDVVDEYNSDSESSIAESVSSEEQGSDVSLREADEGDDAAASSAHVNSFDGLRTRMPWVIDFLRVSSRSLTSAIVFEDVQHRRCFAFAGRHVPLKVLYFDGERLQPRFATTHSGRIIRRARAPKVFCIGHLGEVAGMDALYAVDQRGKVRIYFMLELERQHEETVRSRGPFITFQGTLADTCPNIFRVLNDEFHLKRFSEFEKVDADSETEASSDSESSSAASSCEAPADEALADKAPADEAPADKPQAGKTSVAKPHYLPSDMNDDIGRCLPTDDVDVVTLEKESRLLESEDQHVWYLSVGDVKGGAFIICLRWIPRSPTYETRMKRFYEGEWLQEYYERTKRSRRMQVNQEFHIGQLIDTSPLDRGDREKHQRFWASLSIQVSDTFKLIPGAINCMDYHAATDTMALAGLDRRLYIFAKSVGWKWLRKHKINLKAKVTAVTLG